MLTLVEARNRQGSLLGLPLDDISGGYVMQEVDGLDPVKATLVSSGFANQDGEQYQSSRREARNIKLKIGLEPDFAVTNVRTLRTNLYNFFMPKTEVDLRLFEDDGLTVNISGRIETFESDRFSKEPVVDISIMCFDPDFLALSPTQFEGVTTEDVTEEIISYGGSVETGVVFELNVDRVLNEFTIYHRAPDGSLNTMEFASVPLVTGDILRISTVPGNKEAILTRSGVPTSVLYGVSPQAVWSELIPGDNHIRVYATGAPIPYTITYTTRYGAL